MLPVQPLWFIPGRPQGLAKLRLSRTRFEQISSFYDRTAARIYEYCYREVGAFKNFFSKLDLGVGQVTPVYN